MILADRASDEASIWQLVESCAYTADLSLWSELTAGSESVCSISVAGSAGSPATSPPAAAGSSESTVTRR